MQLLLNHFGLSNSMAYFHSVDPCMMQSYLLGIIKFTSILFSFMDIDDSVNQLWMIKFTGNFTLWIHDVHNRTRLSNSLAFDP